MANEDFDSLKDLLDGLDSEIAALSMEQSFPNTASHAPVKSVASQAPTKSQYGMFASSEYAISHSLFNTPALPFKVRAVQDYMNDMDGNLCFMESEMIEVVAVDDSSGQFLGEMPGGRRGWFPRDFVEIIGQKTSEPMMPPNGFVDFNTDGLSFDPSSVDLGPPPDEDFSKLTFDEPSYNVNHQENGFGFDGVKYADLGPVPDFNAPPSTFGGSDFSLPPDFGNLDSINFDSFGPPPDFGNLKFDDLGPPPTFDDLGPPPNFSDLGAPQPFVPPTHLDDLGPPPTFNEIGALPKFDDLGPPPQFDHSSFGHHPTFDDLGPPPNFDSLGPPPNFDDIGPPPTFDDLGPPPNFDDIGPPPNFDDLGPPPQMDDLGPPPQFHDIGPPPQFDMHRPPQSLGHPSPYGDFNSQYQPQMHSVYGGGATFMMQHLPPQDYSHAVSDFGQHNLKDYGQQYHPAPDLDAFGPPPDFGHPAMSGYGAHADFGLPPDINDLGPPPDINDLGPPPSIDELGPPPSIDDLGPPPVGFSTTYTFGQNAPKNDQSRGIASATNVEMYPWEKHEFDHSKPNAVFENAAEKMPWEIDIPNSKGKEKERPSSLTPPEALSSPSSTGQSSSRPAAAAGSSSSSPAEEASPPEAEDLPVNVEFTPIAQAFNAQTPSQQKEQDKLRKTHEKELIDREKGALAARTKRALAHKISSQTIEKQHDKDVAAQKKDESDRPMKLNAQHVADQKNLQKELDKEYKNRVALHKKAMTTWLGDQQTELKNKISTLKAQYKKDKSTLKQKKGQLEGEAKIRQQLYQEREMMIVDHQFQNEKAKKEKDLGQEQKRIEHDLDLELQQARHKLERRHIQELHREQQKQLQEVHEDETEALALRLPIEEKHLQEQVDLDVEQLTKQQEHEVAEMEQQIQNQQKNERKEFGKKKKLDLKEHENAMKQIKKAKDKNAIAAEKAKFDSQQDKLEKEFEQNLKDEATRKENELKACHEQQKKEMRAAHKSIEEKLRLQHDTLKKNLDRKQASEKTGLASKQKQELGELYERQHKEASLLQKKHHDEDRSLTRQHNEGRMTLFEKQYTEFKELLSGHAVQLQQSPHCTFTDQERQEQQHVEQKAAKDRAILKSECDAFAAKLEEKISASIAELKAEQEKDKRDLL